MKKFKTVILALVLILPLFRLDVFADNNTEMRGVWISSVYNMDWPQTKNNITAQKKEYTDLLDKLKSVGMNTVIVQIRPKSDALYKSSINPWSEYLTGTQGKDPGYDPLVFLIDEAHKRGMEFHAWLNPYRITTSGTDTSKLASNNPAVLHPDWVVKHSISNGEALIYNPGLPEVRQYIVDTVKEIVTNYNVDGIHFDDYFYRSGIDDDKAYKMYGNGMSKDDWRRENVNTLLQEVKSCIKSIKPNVKFGVSPSGIWKNKSSDSTGSDTRGKESYYSDYADTRTWIKRNLVDYITPQIYWPIGYSAADYSKLIPWWANEVKGSNVDLYIGQGVYKQGESSNSNQNIAAEIKDEINLNRQYSEIKGSMYFSARDIIKNTTLQNDLKDIYSDKPKVKPLKGSTRYETATTISKEGWPNGANTVVITSGNSIVDGVTATPLATSYDAPILLSDKDTLTDYTSTELRRLNPKKVIVIGGESVVSNKVITELKRLLPNATTNRIGGIDRYETSLKIAKEIDYINPINKIYVAGGYGEVDALSIAAKAGEEKQPIILMPKDNVDFNSYNWLKSKNLQNAYFIGGNAVLSDNIILKINEITSNNVLSNRVSGDDRQETNGKVIEKFYTNSSYEKVLVTKSNPLVDALTAGPLAAKLKSPIVIVGNSVSKTQSNILEPKKSSLVYEIGGGINTNSINHVTELLK